MVEVVAVGSANPVKLGAVTEVLASFPDLFVGGFDVVSVNVKTSVGDQPITLERTMFGALERAKKAFVARKGCRFGIGVESGVFPIPRSRGWLMNICCCYIWDGKLCSPGLSSAFVVPPKAALLVRRDGVALNKALVATGLSESLDSGRRGGVIETLTQGVVNRQQYIEQAVLMVLFPWINPDHYRST